MSSNYSCTIRASDAKITIEGLFSESLSIDTADDINLKPLIEQLLPLLAEERKIEVIVAASPIDEKQSSIIDTIKKVLEKFNDSVNESVPF